VALEWCGQAARAGRPAPALNSASQLQVVKSSKSGEKFPETSLPGNAVGPKTNEFNCYHSSHFQRRGAML
jgi:hypothetical protein